jgi:carbonic anhydrase/acetyltransferase-like protein (isoleucine patch superfamily)
VSRVVIFGTGRGADVAFRFLSRDTDHEICAFALDGQYIDRNSYRNRPVVAFDEVERRYPPEEYRMLILLGYQGMNGLREARFMQAKAKGYTLESYVASDIFRVEDISVGENCFIMDNQSISLDVRIGDNVVMWSSNHVGDYTTIKDHAWITSHVTIAANAAIGQRAFLGIGATVSNGVSIAPETFVGANVLVSADTVERGVYLAGGADRPEVDSRSFMRVMIAGRKL